ncbi:hypothetical protein [Nostoc sp.]|uniref:hypothetical protein n=1 Tax=Nostoc sp. TaxID=1180 RepID=UPI002FF8AB21
MMKSYFANKLELGIGNWALGTCTERTRVRLVEKPLAQPLQELYWALVILVVPVKF